MNTNINIVLKRTYSTRSPEMVPKDNGILPFMLLPLKFLFEQTRIYFVRLK